MQHNIQHDLNKRRDSGRVVGFSLRQAMLEQMKGRLHNIAQDMLHLEQEWWGRGCALFLGACAEGRAAEKAPCTVELGEACQPCLQRHH